MKSFALFALIIGVAYFSYSVGSCEQALRTSLVWELNDLYSTERYEKERLNQSEVCLRIRSDTRARHASLRRQIDSSVIGRGLQWCSPEINFALHRIEHLIDGFECNNASKSKTGS